MELEEPSHMMAKHNCENICAYMVVSESYIQYVFFFFFQTSGTDMSSLSLNQKKFSKLGHEHFCLVFFNHHSAVILQTRYRVATDERQAKMNLVEPEPGPLRN